MIFAVIYVVASDKIYYLIGSRLEVKDGQLSGDNRSQIVFDNYYNQFLSAGGPDLYFGKGVGYSNGQKVSDYVSSYKLTVIDLGLIGIALILIFYAASVFLLFNSKKGWLLSIVFLVSAYQRPDLVNYYIIIMFIGGLRFIEQSEIEPDASL